MEFCAVSRGVVTMGGFKEGGVRGTPLLLPRSPRKGGRKREGIKKDGTEGRRRKDAYVWHDIVDSKCIIKLKIHKSPPFPVEGGVWIRL